MTIPILPGPWDFLANAGQAVGAVGQGLTQRHVYQQQQAQQNAQLLSSLIEKGLVSPDALASPETHALFSQAGMPNIDFSMVRIPKEQQLAQGFAQEAAKLPPGSSESRATYGVTTPEDVQIKKGAAAKARTEEIANTGLTTEQAQVANSILSAPAAQATQQAELAGAKAGVTKANVQDDLFKSIQKRLPEGGQFQNVSQYAAMGGLGFLTSENEMNARLGAEHSAEHTAQVRLLTAVHNGALRLYSEWKKNWDKGLNDQLDAATGPLSPNANLDPVAAAAMRQQITNLYAKQNPPRSMDEFLQQSIAQYRADDGSYDAAFRDVAGGIKKQDRMGELKAKVKDGTYTEEEIMKDPGLSNKEKSEILGKPVGGVYGPPAPPGVGGSASVRKRAPVGVTNPQ